MGAFVLGRLVETSALGATYLASHVRLEREVAIRLIADRAPNEDPNRRETRQLMAAGAAALVHPNVQRLLLVGYDKGHHFLVMEPVDGEALDRRRIAPSGRLPVELARRTLREAASALSVAASLGIHHRDLQPANLWLTPEGSLKIGGFGVAPFLDDRGLLGAGSPAERDGAPLYRAPELWLGEPITAAADIYALGCTFYHLLTGAPPYASPDLVGCFHDHCLSPVPDARALAPEIADDLADLLRRAMAKTPELRPSAASIVAIVDAMIARPTQARPTQARPTQARSYPETFSLSGHAFSDDAGPSAFWDIGPLKKSRAMPRGPEPR